MARNTRILLIGGSSHTGKSTLARRLAERLGAKVLATDYLARHPGRPWSAPQDRVQLVADHYRNLPVTELMQSVLAHYERVWSDMLAPRLEAAPMGKRLVVEGSAVLPARAGNTAVGGRGRRLAGRVGRSSPEPDPDRERLRRHGTR